VPDKRTGHTLLHHVHHHLLVACAVRHRDLPAAQHPLWARSCVCGASAAPRAQVFSGDATKRVSVRYTHEATQTPEQPPAERARSDIRGGDNRQQKRLNADQYRAP
jgi:hypothetical protein